MRLNAHCCVVLADPTKNSFVSSIQEAERRKAPKGMNKKEPVTKDVLIESCEKYQESTDLLIVRNLTTI